MADEIGLLSATIWHWGWLARTFSPSRRRPLSHSHHLEVAPLPDAVADELLDQAVAERWSVARIRLEAQEEKGKQEIKAKRAARAAQRELDLHQTAVAWQTDAQRVARECRKEMIAAEVALQSTIDALEALADHPGAAAVHGNRRRATVEKLRGILAPGGTGVDLTPHIQPLLDRIWSQSS